MNRFRHFSAGVLVVTLAVIVWGAFVRASGSGAGCGDHWPDCNGTLIPRAANTQTLIEFTHRATSGISFLAVLAMAGWAFRRRAAAPFAFRSAAASLFFMVTEAALGALLVKFEWVANNATASRAVTMSIHLTNTFLLVTALASCCFWAWNGELHRRPLKGPVGAHVFAYVMLLVVGVSGAIAALGDTLAAQAVSAPLVTLLIELRVLHPLLAVLGVVALSLAAWPSTESPHSRPAGIWLLTLTFGQIILGATNVLLRVPLWTQLSHLLVADFICIALVFNFWIRLSADAHPKLTILQASANDYSSR
jgi:heme a synthase